MSKKSTYLPSMSIDDLDRFCNKIRTDNIADVNNKGSNKNSEDLTKLDDMVNLVYDHDEVYSNALKYIKESSLGTMFRTTKLTIPTLEAETKVKASSKDLNLLLNQVAFGTTGVWVKLLHSGFSVKLKPMNAVTKINIQASIANGVIEFVRLINGDINTGVYVYTEEEIIKVFISHIEYSTFDIPMKKNILKYIKTKDLNLIKVGLLAIMNPNGYNGFKYICGETIEISSEDKENKDDKEIDKKQTTICSRESDEFVLDLEDLVYVENDMTEEELIQMQKTQKGCLTEKDVLSYQEKFKYNNPISETLDDNTKTTIVLDPSNLYTYITKSKKYMEEVILKSNIVSKTEIDLLVNMINTSSVGKYYYAISRIETESLYIDSDSLSIDAVLTISSNIEISNKIIELGRKVNSQSAYIIGVPRYTCPICLELKKNKSKDKEETAEDDSLVTPINVLNLFFYLV